MPETNHAPRTGAPLPAAARADVVIRIGAILTVIGIILTLIAMLPLVTDIELPSAWWFLSMITGIGLAVIIVGLILSARSRSSQSVPDRSVPDRSAPNQSRFM